MINLVNPSLVGEVDDLRTFDGNNLFDNHLFLVADLNRTTALFRWTIGNFGDDDGQLLVVPTLGDDVGSFVRADNCFSLKLPWEYNTPDDEILAVIPDGIRVHIARVIPEVTTPLVGPSTASIGIGTSVSLIPFGLNFVEGPHLSGFVNGESDELDEPRRTTLVGGEVIKHKLIIPGYTAGAGNWHLVCALIQT